MADLPIGGRGPSIFDELLQFFYTNPLNIAKVESLSEEKIHSLAYGSIFLNREIGETNPRSVTRFERLRGMIIAYELTAM